MTDIIQKKIIETVNNKEVKDILKGQIEEFIHK